MPAALLADLNKAVDEGWSTIPAITWESATDFSINFRGKVYWVELKDNKLSQKSVVVYPEGANQDYHKVSGNIAYTINNNLHFQNKAGHL